MNNEKKKGFSDFSYINFDEIMHYGTPRHSGRYPWGSGENPYQRTGDFLTRRDELKDKGWSDKQIYESMGMSSTQYRAMNAIAQSERRALLVAAAKSLKADGLSGREIAEKLDLPGESSVRSLLNAESEERMNLSMKTANNLKKLVDEKGIIDVGKGTERQLDISPEKLKVALEICKIDGYELYNIRIDQVTNKGQNTELKLLCPPGTPYKDAYVLENIHSVTDYTTRDNGDTLEPSFRYPSSLDSNRIQIRYSDQGGADKDGVIELRRGVNDLDLGEANYAQVRILVDGKYYLKGMAVYSDKMPPGKDIIFNTNKKSDVPLEDVLKKIKDDPDNPFGATIGHQLYYDDPNGKYTDPETGKKQSLSPINVARMEGEWDKWHDAVSSQFLSKQSISLIKKQLNLTYKDKLDEFNEIMNLTNPVVKRDLLEDFAEDCDSASVFLNARAFDGQKYKVILPINSLKDNEVYAPHLSNGTEVALVRYPHGGLFEIPKLVVNNTNAEGKQVMTATPSDAVGINSHVAGRLSGADFDGDFVMCIPITNKNNIINKPPLSELKNFDPKLDYKGKLVEEIDKNNLIYERAGKKFKGMNNTQIEMGKISNLITDMTLAGATNEELARAVKHSMVVIDAEKHGLDYRQSAIDNGIKELVAKYQTKIDPITGVKTSGGVATLISRAKGELDIKERKEGIPYAHDTGNVLESYDPYRNLYIDKKTGKIYNREKRGQIDVVKVDPNTGEKLYHDTKRVYPKVIITDPDTGKPVTVNAWARTDEDNKRAQPGLPGVSIYYKDPKTKEVIKVTNEKYVLKDATEKSTRMAETSDAHTLSSGNIKEEAYAEYANKIKALANTARKEALAIKDPLTTPSAKKIYKEEVTSLDEKIRIAELNAPRERMAQTLANQIVAEKKAADPNLDKEHEKRMRQQVLTKTRAQVGAKRQQIEITDKEWEAIQSGAVSASKLKTILKYADGQRVRQLSMPRNKVTVTQSKINKINALAKQGKTLKEIADAVGLSVSTVNSYL